MIKPSNLICININKLNINIKCIVFKLRNRWQKMAYYAAIKYSKY